MASGLQRFTHNQMSIPKIYFSDLIVTFFQYLVLLPLKSLWEIMRAFGK